jgi:hypothetical protein
VTAIVIFFSLKLEERLEAKVADLNHEKRELGKGGFKPEVQHPGFQ